MSKFTKNIKPTNTDNLDKLVDLDSSDTESDTEPQPKKQPKKQPKQPKQPKKQQKLIL